MKNIKYLPLILLIIAVSEIHAQAGIAVTPGRVYFNLTPGTESTQRIKVTNPTNGDLEVGVSFNDWDYKESGANNIVEAGSLNISCSDWIQILPDTYFILGPKESRDVEISMQVPQDIDLDIPVRTSMIFFTQLNPGDATTEQGAGIRVTVRMGVKVYHSFEQETANELDIVDFKKQINENEQDILSLHIKNIGRTWTNGIVNWEVFNKETGKKTKLSSKEFYTLPDDLRIINQQLPEDIEPGDYTISAIVTYGDSDIINIAEMDFVKE